MTYTCDEPFGEIEAQDDTLFKLALVNALRDIASSLDGINHNLDVLSEALPMRKNGSNRYVDVCVDGEITNYPSNY